MAGTSTIGIVTLKNHSWCRGCSSTKMGFTHLDRDTSCVWVLARFWRIAAAGLGTFTMASIVLFGNHLTPIKAPLLQEIADAVHHLLQSADVDVEVSPPSEDLVQMLLHAPGEARP